MKNWCFIFALLFAVSASAQPLLIDEEAEPAAEDNGKPEMLSAENGGNAESGAEAAPAEGEAAAEENADENANPEEPEPKPVEYLPNPSNFSADFMSSLYQCQPAKEQQNLAGFEEVSVIGSVSGRCQLKYDDFILAIPSELLPNIHSMSDIRQLLLNNDIAHYQPQYEYAGLLQELNICSKSSGGHSAYLHRQFRNDVAITKGLTSKVENGGCTIRLLNQLNMNDSFRDYSVICRIPANDMQLILGAYADLLTNPNASDEAYKKADAEIMFRLQQVGYCQKPKL